MKKPRFSWKWFLSMCALALVPVGINWWRARQPKEAYTFPTPELAAINRVVQARMAVPPTNDFGALRVGKRHEYFMPQTTDERAAATALRATGQNVVFYMVGRSILRGINGPDYPHTIQGPIHFTPEAAAASYQPVYNKNTGSRTRAWSRLPPAAASANGTGAGNVRYLGSSDPVRWQSVAVARENLPDEAALTAVAQRAFDASASKEGERDMVGKWEVSAVPVRATSQDCLTCHVGRPLNSGKFPWRDRIRVGDTLGIALYCRQLSSEPRR